MRQTTHAVHTGLLTDAFRMICRAFQGVRPAQIVEHRRAGYTKVDV